MFSLVVTTQGGKKEALIRLLASLELQTYTDFEIVFIDQTGDASYDWLVKSVSCEIKHIKTEKLSLSAARNIGLSHVCGDIVAFPDDDCWYDECVLDQINGAFSKQPSIGCFCCMAYDPFLDRPLSSLRIPEGRIEINAANAMKYPISIGIFVRREHLIQFDEDLGVGAKWGAGEETDFIYRLLDKRVRCVYDSSIRIFHQYINAAGPDQLSKVYRYGQGCGACIKKAVRRGQCVALLDLASIMIRSCGGVVFHSVKRDSLSRVYQARLRGIFSGLLSY